MFSVANVWKSLINLEEPQISTINPFITSGKRNPYKESFIFHATSVVDPGEIIGSGAPLLAHDVGFLILKPKLDPPLCVETE